MNIFRHKGKFTTDNKGDFNKANCKAICMVGVTEICAQGALSTESDQNTTQKQETYQVEVGIDGEHHRLVFALDDALGTVKYFSKHS